MFRFSYSFYIRIMKEKNIFELRFSAQLYREMSMNGDDPQLKVALLQLAEEFEQEAAKLETNPAGTQSRPCLRALSRHAAAH